MHVLISLIFSKQNNFYLPKVKFHPLLTIFFVELHTASFINQILVSHNISVKRFPSLRDTCAEFVWYFLIFSSRVAIWLMNRYHVQPVHARFGRCLRFAEKKLMFLFLVLFLRRGNGLTAKMESIGVTRRTKEDIEIHEELMAIQHWRWQRDKNFNFITFNQNGGNIFEAYAVRISCRGFF